MKKALVVLLILAVAGGLFAQTLSKTITADFETDLFYISADHTGDQQKNLLTSSKFDSTELRLRIDYKGDNFTAYIRLNFDGLLARGKNYADTNEGSFSEGKATPFDLLYSTFDEYGLTGTAGMWKAYIGNEANRGVVDRFQQGYDDFLGIKIDNYGIFALANVTMPGRATLIADADKKVSIPYSKDGLSVSAWDVNNFAQKVPHGYTTAPWFGVFADLKDYVPITVGVAGSLNDKEKSTPSSYQSGNAAIRISGNKIADLVSFDAIYKYYTWDGVEIDGSSTHTFGLYANLFVLEGLGIGVGYSGSVKTAEDKDAPTLEDPDKKKEISHPFYSGIDLRVKYSLAPFTFTLNNNISFASAEGSKDDIVYGFNSTFTPKSGSTPAYYTLQPLTEKESESYFGLYNALAVEYKVSDTLTVKFLLGNRLISYSYEDSTDTNGYSADILYDQLQTALLASFALNANVTFRAGLDVKNTYTSIDGSTKIDGASWETTKFGTLEFGIPVGLKIVF
jgi:hypothetical protein